MSEITQPQISFSEYLKLKFSLEKNGETFKGQYLNDAERVDVYFTESDINTVNPKLADALNAMFSTRHSPSDTVPVDWLNDTIQYWESPIKLKNIHGTEVVFSEVIVLGGYSEKNDAIELKGFVFNIHEKDGIHFVAGRRMGDFFIPSKELEKHYPGSKIRYELLSAVNTEPRELVKLVLQSTIEPVLTQALPQASFD